MLRADFRLAFLLATFGAGLLLPSEKAQAGQFIPIALEDLATQSAVVIVGRVQGVLAEPQGPHGLPGIHTRVRVEIEETLAGNATGTVDFWVHGGRLGSQLRVVTGQAQFTAGEEVLLFLFQDPHGALWPSGMARGKWHLHQSAGRRWATPAAPLDGTETAASRTTSSAALPTLDLADLRRRIQQARAARSAR